MLKNYFRSAFRSLHKNKAHALINISGLATGMAVTLLIGLWIYDETHFDTYHANYTRIAQVMLNQKINGSIQTGTAIPFPLEAEMRKNYSSDFTHLVMSSWNDPHVLTAGEKNITYRGSFMSADAPEMFSLHVLHGNAHTLRNPSSLLVSETVARALFGETDAINKLILLDNKTSFTVGGVYADLPANSSLHEISFIASWDFFASNPEWLQRNPLDWNDNSLFMYVQIAEHADMAKLSEKIKSAIADHVVKNTAPEIFLQPMNRWHLYSEFRNGVNTGGAVQYLWLFGIIGFFVLLLACINFMNLSTARSEKRAKEVSIRKTIGSGRTQLIHQFFFESLFFAAIAWAASLFLASIALPFFNQVSGKNISIPWSSVSFWLAGSAFTFFTGLLAGIYPALYLSSFQPIKILKGTYRAGPFAAMPRKVLVVLQFTVSVILIIGTMVVYEQIRFAKNRPVGYSREGLIAIEVTNGDLHRHFTALRAELKRSGSITEIAESSSPTTGINNDRGDVDWKGKDPARTIQFGNIAVNTTYGKTIGWQFIEGRDFSSELPGDSASVILNESAVKYMGFRNAVGELIHVGKRYLTVIGVAKDMVMQSPFEPAKPSIFFLGRGGFDDVLIRINPAMGLHDAIAQVSAICKTYSPSVPFSFRFADEEYVKKFTGEERVGKLAGFFSALAVFISCLGLFGMAGFMAEQRIKEIGIRKVLGATVTGIWILLCREFVVLILVALCIAMPAGYLLMSKWLQGYSYRVPIALWIFLFAAVGAILITLLTVSYQSIKAALTNPAKSLQTE